MKQKAMETLKNQTPSKSERKQRRREKKKLAADEAKKNAEENYRNATHFITPNTDFTRLFSENFNVLPKDIPGLCLTGLHTCGDLASSCLRIFRENEQISAVCNIGCCYHLLTEEFSQTVFSPLRREKSSESQRRDIFKPHPDEYARNTYGFPMSRFLRDDKTPLGRNARMLACQSIHRVIDRKELPNNNLFYRALFEVLIQRKCPENLDSIEVGKLKMCSTFVEYVRKSSKRNPCLKFDDISDDELTKLHQEFAEEKSFLDIYFLMRVSIAPLVETVLLLDRLLYLKEMEENGDSLSTSYLVRFFDPVVSPRCFGIVAIKN